MSQAPTAVLDASALLAYLREEPGADVVEDALDRGAAISAANWAETLSKMADFGYDPDTIANELADEGILYDTLTLCPLDGPAALEVARLRPLTTAIGLSLGDRACLALGRILALPVLTADHAWQTLNVGVTVQTIR